MAEPVVRVRLEFEDPRCLLSKSQRKDGLSRCWLLLGPHLATVADVAIHIIRSFTIGRSCPRGIILYMDEFTLPPFESTSIFRDDDIVRVRKKAGKQRQLMETCGNTYCIQDSNNVAKECVLLKEKLLASHNFPENSRANKRTKRAVICVIEQVTSTHAVCNMTNVKRKRPDQLLENENTSKPKSHVKDKEKGTASNPQPLGQIATAEDELVPIVFRPGYVRFRPIDEELHKSSSEKAAVPLQGKNGMNGKGENGLGSVDGQADESESVTWNDMQGYRIKGKPTSTDPWELAISKVKAIDSATHVTESPPPDFCWGPIDKDSGQFEQNGWDSWISNKSPPNSWAWAGRKRNPSWSSANHPKSK